MMEAWLVAGVLYILGGVLAAERTEAIERGEGFTAHPVEKVVIAVFWPVFAVLVFVEWL